MSEPSDEFHYDHADAPGVEPGAAFQYDALHRSCDQFIYHSGFERIVDAVPAYCHHIMMTYDAEPVADEPIIVLARGTP
jgi:hypothetical protein